MKKNKKTTDSVLKDIFDSIKSAEDKLSHPLSDFSAPARPKEEGMPTNRIESFIVEEKLPEVIEAAPEVKPVSVIEEPQIPTPQAKRSLKVLNIAAVIAGLLALLAASLILSVIWRAEQNREAHRQVAPAKVQAVSKVPVAGRAQSLAPNPILVKIDRLDHPGVLFKNYSVKNNKLMVRGFVANQAQAVRFVNSMNGSPYFKKAWISSIQEVHNSSGKKSYEFQIYADVNP